MCGIVAIDKLTELTRDMIPALALEIERRGMDSWGLTDGKQIYRKLGPISEGLLAVLKAGTIDNWQKLLMHTRAASTGTIDLINCHPLLHEHNGRTVCGIHNGVISNHEEQNRILGRNLTCDSMHLFQNLVEGSNWEDLRGWGVALWTDSIEDHETINFAKLTSNADITVMQLESGEIIACSWGDSIRRAVRWAGGKIKSDFRLKPEVHYQMLNGEVVEVGPMIFNKYPIVSHTHYSMAAAGTVLNLNQADREMCVYCGRNAVDSDKTLVCQGCFVELIEGVDDTWVMPDTQWNARTLERLGKPNLDIISAVKKTIGAVCGTN